MIPIEQLSKRAKKLYDDINSAKLYINGQVIEGVIKKKTIKDNTIKVFIGMGNNEGTIEKIEIYDIDGDLLQVQDMQIEKSNHYKFLAVVEIRVENEVENGRY